MAAVSVVLFNVYCDTTCYLVLFIKDRFTRVITLIISCKTFIWMLM